MRTMESYRCLIRPFQLGDAADVYEYSRSQNVGIHAGWQPHLSLIESTDYVERWIMQTDIRAIVLKETNTVIGTISVRIDSSVRDLQYKLGYMIGEDYWNQGLMTEVVRSVLDEIFYELNARSCILHTYSYNQRSVNVAEKCGFRLAHVKPKSIVRFDNAVLDDLIYQLSAIEYIQKFGGKLIAQIRHVSEKINGSIFYRHAVRAIVKKGDHYLFVQSRKFNDVKFPGGGVEINENNITALLREVREETGYIVIPNVTPYGYTDEINKSIFPDTDFFQMRSDYYCCDVYDETTSQELDDYEREYGYEAIWMNIEEALTINLSLPKSDQLRWVRREIEVMKKLLRESKELTRR